MAGPCPDNQAKVEALGGVVALACLARHYERRDQRAAQQLAERALYECAFANRSVGYAIAEARTAAAMDLIALERPSEWERFRREGLRAPLLPRAASTRTVIVECQRG